MLRRIEASSEDPPGRVRGDGTAPPFRRGVFQEVAMLGNAIGFAGAEADRLLQQAEGLVQAGGGMVLEVVAGPGERSSYLSRLPSSSLPRLLRAPLRALLRRIDREGFVLSPARKADPGAFRRYDPSELAGDLAVRGWTVNEVLAVAPALGSDPQRLEQVSRDPAAWARLLDLEELLGRRVERLRSGAAVLLSATAGPQNGGIK